MYVVLSIVPEEEKPFLEVEPLPTIKPIVLTTTTEDKIPEYFGDFANLIEGF